MNCYLKELYIIIPFKQIRLHINFESKIIDKVIYEFIDEYPCRGWLKPFAVGRRKVRLPWARRPPRAAMRRELMKMWTDEPPLSGLARRSSARAKAGMGLPRGAEDACGISSQDEKGRRGGFAQTLYTQLQCHSGKRFESG
jgi:hypothetical protein